MECRIHKSCSPVWALEALGLYRSVAMTLEVVDGVSTQGLGTSTRCTVPHQLGRRTVASAPRTATNPPPRRHRQGCPVMGASRSNPVGASARAVLIGRASSPGVEPFEQLASRESLDSCAMPENVRNRWRQTTQRNHTMVRGCANCTRRPAQESISATPDESRSDAAGWRAT